MLNNMGYTVKNQKESSPESLRGGIERKQRREKDHKGFTLVELIVVIVILAILAAILVPGLLKWIDEAKKKQYELEARSIAQAAQAEAIKLYGKGEEFHNQGSELVVAFDGHEGGQHYNEMTNIEKLSGIDNVEFVSIYFGGEDRWEIKKVNIVYYSDGKMIIAVFNADDGKWKIS